MAILDPDFRYATASFVGTGSSGPFEFNFTGGYIDKSDIVGYIQDAVGVKTQVTLGFTGANTVTTSQPVPVGSVLYVYRSTPKDEPIVSYADGAGLPASDLNLDSRQAILGIAEMVDRIGDAEDDARRALDLASQAVGFDPAYLATKDEVTYTRNLARAQLTAALGTPDGFQSSVLGTLLRTFAADLDDRMSVKRFGAKGDGVADDTAAINAALAAAAVQGRTVWFPAGTYLLTSTVTIPALANIQGDGWRSTIFKTAGAFTALVLNTSSIIRDVGLDGNNVGTEGIHVNAGNRVHMHSVRIASFTGNGLYVGIMNNSSFIDVFVQYCAVNFYIDGALNCSFIQCNGNLADNCPSTYRNIKIVGTAQNPTRNTRFWGGIYERGSPTNQVEVLFANNVVFRDMEINASVGGPSLLVSGGDVKVDTVQFTLGGGTNIAGVASGANSPRIRFRQCSYTGTGGKSVAEMWGGAVQQENQPYIESMRSTFGTDLDGWAASAGGTVSYDSTNHIALGGGATASQGMSKLMSSTANMPAGTVLRVRVAMRSISAGNAALYIGQSASPFRKLIGPLTAGFNELTLVADGTETWGLQITAGESVAKTWSVRGISADVL